MALSIEFFESLNDSYPIDLSQFTNLCSASAALQPPSSPANSSKSAPIDFRIGTKARIVSPRPFPWMKNVMTTGTYSVVIPPEDISLALRFSMNGCAEFRQLQSLIFPPLAVLQAATIFYQSAAPSARPVFPRLAGTFSNRKPTKNVTENAFTTEWIESFDHLHATWLAGERDYFYICAFSYTILFLRAMYQQGQTKQFDAITNSVSKSKHSELTDTLNSSPALLAFEDLYENQTRNEITSGRHETSHQIIVTPTTLGFRELLSAEGIKFSMPLRNVNKSFMDYAIEKGDKDFISLEKHESDDDASGKFDENEDLDEDEWLKDIGISPKSTLRFRRTYSSVEFPSADFDDLNECEEKPQSVKILDAKTEANSNLTRKRKALNSISSTFNSQQPKKQQSQTPQSQVQKQRQQYEDTSRSTIVIVEPTSRTAFVGLVRTLRVGISRNGLHAGLAPTLLAASPFLGAIPKRLKLSSHVTKKAGDLKYVLELNDGPIMPFVPTLLAEFLFASSDSINDGGNASSDDRAKFIAQLQVLGRVPYSGLNESADEWRALNVTDLNVDVVSKRYNWK